MSGALPVQARVRRAYKRPPRTHLIESKDLPPQYRGTGPATFMPHHRPARMAVCGTVGRQQDLTDVAKFVTCKRCRRYLP